MNYKTVHEHQLENFFLIAVDPRKMMANLQVYFCHEKAAYKKPFTVRSRFKTGAGTHQTERDCVKIQNKCICILFQFKKDGVLMKLI